MIITDDKCNRQTNGTPQREAPPYPVPHRENVIGGNAKFLHFLQVGRHRHKMRGNIFLRTCFQEPSTDGLRIAERLAAPALQGAMA